MTLQEFSIEFDMLYNNISSDQAPGLTEYEKSVFLTQAQNALVLDLYKGTSGDSFESTEEVTRYLYSLVKTYTEESLEAEVSFGFNKYTITPSSDVLFIVYQSAISDKNRDLLVVPTTHDKLFKDLNNPFKRPNSNKVLAVSDENGILLYSKDALDKYYFKYLRLPKPIILETMNDGLTIGNENTQSDTELPESLHMQILLRAVQIAKNVWQS